MRARSIVTTHEAQLIPETERLIVSAWWPIPDGPPPVSAGVRSTGSAPPTVPSRYQSGAARNARRQCSEQNPTPENPSRVSAFAPTVMSQTGSRPATAPCSVSWFTRSIVASWSGRRPTHQLVPNEPRHTPVGSAVSATGGEAGCQELPRVGRFSAWFLLAGPEPGTRRRLDVPCWVCSAPHLGWGFSILPSALLMLGSSCRPSGLEVLCSAHFPGALGRIGSL